MTVNGQKARVLGTANLVGPSGEAILVDQQPFAIHVVKHPKQILTTEVKEAPLSLLPRRAPVASGVELPWNQYR